MSLTQPLTFVKKHGLWLADKGYKSECRQQTDVVTVRSGHISEIKTHRVSDRLRSATSRFDFWLPSYIVRYGRLVDVRSTKLLGWLFWSQDGRFHADVC